MSNDKTEERAAFEAWFDGFRHGWKTERDVALAAWQARAALSSAPAQPVREPMTDQQIRNAVGANSSYWAASKTWFVAVARAIERHHGITKE